MDSNKEEITMRILTNLVVHKGDLIKSSKNEKSALWLAYEINDDHYYDLLIRNCDGLGNFLSTDLGQSLLTKMIKDQKSKSLQITLEKCSIDATHQECLLNLALEAIKAHFIEGFGIILHFLGDRNIMLSNGETFMTNLMKTENDDKIIIQVIKSGLFDLNVPNAKKESVLMLACSKLKKDIIEICLKYGSDVKYNNFAALQSVCMRQNEENKSTVTKIINILVDPSISAQSENIHIVPPIKSELELVEGIWMRCSKEVSSSRGQLQDKYIIFQCNGKQCSALLKWKGAINNDGIFLGCEIEKPIAVGTNGTFGEKNLFRCKDGCGVLIPENKLNFCCLTDGHKELKISNNRIDEKTICCIKPMEKSSLNTKILLNERLRKTNASITGIYKWVGLVNKKEVIGLDSNKIQDGTDGTFCGIKLFHCNRPCGALFESEYFDCEYQLVRDIGIKIIDSFHIKNIENGSPITKQMYLNPKLNKQPFNVRWAGCIDGKLCIGCVLHNNSEYGTNGTFAGQKLFECADKKGVLIPDDELRDGCSFEKHKEISKIGRFRERLGEINKNIDPTSICCAQWLKDIKILKNLQIDSRIKINNQPNFTGSCKWLGLINGKDAVGVEMDIDCGGTAGRFLLFDLFSCKNGRGFLFMAEDIIYDVDSEKPHFIVDQIIDINKIFSVKPLNNQMETKQFLRKPAIVKIENREYLGEIKWIGLINAVKCVGLDMENHFDYGMDGKINDGVTFECMKGHGLMTPMTNIKLSDIAPNLIDDSVINPHKYLELKEDWNREFLKERNVHKNGFVFVKFRKEDTETELKGKLRWCGLMNKVPIAVVELVEDHEYGTNGFFWRQKLFNCPDKRAIAVLWHCIHQYLPYRKMDIPINERVFPQIDKNFAVKSYINDGQNELKEVCGTVKWTGIDENGQYMYGVELHDRIENGTDGQFEGQQLFNCQPGHGLLFPLDKVLMDTRFVEEEFLPENISESEDSDYLIPGHLAFLKTGFNKGIQGNANSCYFDSAIFALFSKSDVLDYMISPTANEKEKDDITIRFREIISWKIVYPLREFGFVSFHKTYKMRNIIKEYGPKFEEMVNKEFDMENVSKLLEKLCPNEKLLSMISHNNIQINVMFLQLFLVMKNKLEFMNSEDMLKLSLIQNSIFFEELPSCLIMQAPRDAKVSDCYKYALPKNTIEISDICSHYFKKCYKCDEEAKFICSTCMDTDGRGISSCFMCNDHKCNHEGIFANSSYPAKTRSKVFMELKAIICIAKCHFVSYVKQVELVLNERTKLVDKESKWYIFDSRSSQSIKNNYAVPKVAYSEEVSRFLNSSEDHMKDIINGYNIDNIKLIVNDSYIFVYHNSAKTCY